MKKKVTMIGLTIFVVVVGICLYTTRREGRIPVSAISPKKEPKVIPNKKVPKGPNVLLISLDTLRADHLHCYGYDRETSPNIDKFAEEGVLFSQNTSAAPLTTPSHMSMFTSLYPSVHGVVSTERKLAESLITLAEILKEQDYTTSAFISAPIMLPYELGFGQGFDHYDDFTITLDQEADLFMLNDRCRGQNDHPICPITHDMVVSWLENNYHKKFFIFLHYWDIHGDYAPSYPYNTMFDPGYEGDFNGDYAHIKMIKPGISERDLEHMIALYDGEIRYVDSYIEKLFNKLEELNLMDKTLIILTADHGEEFLEHGSNWHGKTMYDEVTHVPLIMRYPTSIPKNKVISSQVSSVDIMPTILDILGISIEHQIQGQTLLPLVLEEEKPASMSAYCEADLSGRELKSVRVAKYKFIYSERDKKEELYDLVDDPNEQNNLIESRPELTKVLRKGLSEWMDSSEKLLTSLPEPTVSEEIEYRKDLKEKLKSLGYMQ